jgi:hypothetical protein
MPTGFNSSLTGEDNQGFSPGIAEEKVYFIWQLIGRIICNHMERWLRDNIG